MKHATMMTQFLTAVLMTTMISASAWAISSGVTETYLVGDMDCNDGQIQAQILINAMDQHVLVSDLVVEGRTIKLSQVKIFKSNDSELEILAPGLKLVAKLPGLESNNRVGIREGQGRVNGKATRFSCLVPEIADFPQ